ncbi:alpha-1,2-fucosyltransferase [Luteolibacter soli]|uniref:Alpha-1,2-fucosyltransferase n=1 Tax=Luteolibacter soli TaxID=3135280 RepID=A0ABU9ASY1_9BACT
MIRIVLLGRSGNHLFQYAFGRVLAKRHGVPLVLDCSWFNSAGWREVSHLLRLPLRAKVTRRASLAARALLRLTGRHYWEYRGLPVVREPELNQAFHPDLLDAPADCVVRGYFQSYKYFVSIEEELRSELLGLLENVVPEKSSSSTQVAVHVRRTDFLKHAAFQVCDLGYYRQSMERMRDLVPGAHFTIFSDDRAWCLQNLNGPDIQVASPPDPARGPLTDLARMSRANHHIIANSSYSWWAAWLGKKEGQRVLMPDAWFRGDIHAPIEDKCCPGWELVPTTSAS